MAIRVNGEQVNFTSFPDKTSSFRYSPDGDFFRIDWLYDGDHECILLWYLVKHIRSCCGKEAPIELYMPYIPNARMDRVKADDEVFTLKWFADFINSMEFGKVYVLDPHSNVAVALINNLYTRPVKDYIRSVRDMVSIQLKQNVLLCYPDEGSAKRYADMLGMEYVFCIKHRNWRTGKIERLELTSPDKVKERNILIVDDICSRGGTFTFTAKALKEAGANEVYLYVTHCEDTIFKGTVLTDGLISHIFTTDSIFRGEHKNITVIPAWRG